MIMTASAFKEKPKIEDAEKSAIVPVLTGAEHRPHEVFDRMRTGRRDHSGVGYNETVHSAEQQLYVNGNVQRMENRPDGISNSDVAANLGQMLKKLSAEKPGA